MKRLLVKHIRYLVTCDNEDRILRDVNMYIEDGVIKAIDQNDHEADEVIDGRHLVIYPGLVNTHHHLYQILTRNLPQVQNLELFDWLRVLYEIWKNLSPQAIYDSSLCGLSELVKYGCTTVFDHHYVFPENSDTFIARQFEAAETLGVRMVSSRGSMDLSKKDGGLPPDSVVQTIDQIMASSDELISQYHDPSFGSFRQIVLAPCSPFSVTGELMKESAVLARKRGVRLHTHLAETIDEENYMLSSRGIRPLEYMEQLGWVGDDVWYAHGIHFNDEELRLLAKTGAGVAHCPASNMKLSSGVARIPDMLKLGVKVGLAVDGSASNDGSSMMEEMRISYLLHRLTYHDQAPSGYDILKMATRGSASLLGRTDIGYLADGMCADFFALNVNRLELAGATFDVSSMLATVGVKAPVDVTVVHGKIVVKDGQLAKVDEQALAARIYEESKEMQNL